MLEIIDTFFSLPLSNQVVSDAQINAYKSARERTIIQFGECHFRLSIYPICDTVSTQYKVCSYYINT